MRVKPVLYSIRAGDLDYVTPVGSSHRSIADPAVAVGCAASPPQSESLDYRARAETRVDAGVQVSAVVLSPEENWLLIPREELNLSPQMRVYVPDLEKMKTWLADVRCRL